METIIAASDLSERSAHVPGRAAALARVLGARLILVYVAAPGAPALVIEDARSRLQAQTSPLDDTAFEIRVLKGKPEIEIPDLATDVDATLLVLGLHRVRPVLDLLRLTTMERIVLRAPCPVLIAQLPHDRPYSCVLSSSDFAPACAAALASAARLAPGAEFHAIHALQLPLIDKLSPSEIEDSRAMTQADLLREQFVQMPGVPGTLHRPEIVPGGVHEVLAFRLDELRPDLLTIGTHSGRDPMTLGNYARDLMREPPVDVLVAKPPRG